MLRGSVTCHSWKLEALHIEFILQARHMQRFCLTSSHGTSLDQSIQLIYVDMLLKHLLHQQQAKALKNLLGNLSFKFLTFGPSSRTKRDRENGTPGHCRVAFNMKTCWQRCCPRWKIWKGTNIIPRASVTLGAPVVVCRPKNGRQTRLSPLKTHEIGETWNLHLKRFGERWISFAKDDMPQHSTKKEGICFSGVANKRPWFLVGTPFLRYSQHWDWLYEPRSLGTVSKTQVAFSPCHDSVLTPQNHIMLQVPWGYSQAPRWCFRMASQLQSLWKSQVATKWAPWFWQSHHSSHSLWTQLWHMK